jgi:hypothetical protein
VRADITPPRDESVWAFRAEDTGRAHGVDLSAQLDHPLGRAMDLGAYPNDVPKVELDVPSEWQRFDLDFDQFGVDGHAVASVDFVAGEGGGDVDLWIDDLSLRSRTACPSRE